MVSTPHDRYPLRTVSRLTGLSPDVIRAWEKRYQVVEPIRGPRGARLYTRDDIDHLTLLGGLVAQGRAIGDIARLSIEALRMLGDQRPTRRIDHAAASRTPEAVAEILACVERFDLREVEVGLGDALLALGATRFVEEVAQPLLVEVGNRWAEGRMSVADEHLVSAALRRILSGLIRLRPAHSSAGLLLATPSGEQHELGLMLVALLAVETGVRIYLVGADLPAVEIVDAAQRAAVAAVGLSIVNPHNRRNALRELREIEERLKPHVELWIGGQDAQQLAAELRRERVLTIDTPAEVQFHLHRLRNQAAPART
jgi:DNA-binding transcriptional MerR regulator/methylmalonyl-CoA mutase cobalamin-binding subunit